MSSQVQKTQEETFVFQDTRTDYSISTLLGLSSSIVTVIFVIVAISFQIAGLNISNLIQGNFQITGDPSMLYMSTFLISATLLLVTQHHLASKTKED